MLNLGYSVCALTCIIFALSWVGCCDAKSMRLDEGHCAVTAVARFSRHSINLALGPYGLQEEEKRYLWLCLMHCFWSAYVACSKQEILEKALGLLQKYLQTSLCIRHKACELYLRIWRTISECVTMMVKLMPNAKLTSDDQELVLKALKSCCAPLVLMYFPEEVSEKLYAYLLVPVFSGETACSYQRYLQRPRVLPYSEKQSLAACESLTGVLNSELIDYFDGVEGRIALKSITSLIAYGVSIGALKDHMHFCEFVYWAQQILSWKSKRCSLEQAVCYVRQYSSENSVVARIPGRVWVQRMSYIWNQCALTPLDTHWENFLFHMLNDEGGKVLRCVFAQYMTYYVMRGLSFSRRRA